MKNLTWQNPEQLFVAQELINKVKSKCCGIKVKHGLAGKDGKKELMVYVSRETNGIRITVTDNGRGYLPQVVSATRGTGTGLKVLYQTIQLLNTKNKSDKIRFNITNRSDGQTGTEVSVYIPFRFSYDL